MKRVISVLLIAAMILSVVAVTGAAEKLQTPDEVFEAIDAALLASSAFRSPLTDAEKTHVAKSAVENLGYQTEDRGNCCFVFEVGDEPCIFNCRMYNILSEMKPLEGYVDDGEVVTVDYGTRSTGPANGAKDVVLIEPFYGTDSSFTKQYQTEASSIAKATGGTYTLYKTSAATIDAVADGIENAAVVIFDSHGDTDYMASYYSEDYVSKANTSYLLLATGTGLTSADKSRATGEFNTYNHAYSSSGYYYVDGTAITNHMEKSAPNNLVWMAICLGMATDGLEKPFRDHGVGVVYGYSQSVTFDGDYDYEATFWSNMKNGEDVQTAISAMKSKHGNWDPGMGCSSISSARRNYAAFPIVVSDLDVYPGHGNVDALQTVYSDWTLFGGTDPVPTYTVTAATSDALLGSVHMDGNVITAEPKENCKATGYTVTPTGACKVTQTGNQFTVSNVTADCTVTIQFAECEKVTVSFSVPEGVICDPIEVFAGDTVKLPTPTGTLTADKYDYTFVGWTDAPISDTSTKPTYSNAGKYVTANADMTFYALYSYKTGKFQMNYTTQPEKACPHDWDKGQITKQPNCTETGTVLYTCSLCGETKTEKIAALGHDYNVETIAPTTEVQGYDLHTCVRCGYFFMDNYTDPIPVDPTEPTVPTEPTEPIDPTDPTEPTETDPCEGYTDIDRSSWYHSAADFVIENGYMGSTITEALTFEPMTQVSRSMVASILYRIAGDGTEVEYRGIFSDVEEGKWFTTAIEWCAQKGLASGKGDGTFDPMGNVTRQELAVFMYKLAEYMGRDVSGRADLNDFADAKTVPAWSKDYLAWAVDAGIISGQASDGVLYLNPTTGALRCELASILMRFFAK